MMRRRGMMAPAASTPLPVSNLLYNWDFTKSMTDTIESVVATTNATQDSTGVYFGGSEKYLRMAGTYDRDRTIWVTFTDFSTRNGGSSAKNGRIMMASNGTNTGSGGHGFIYRNNNTMAFYTGSWNSGSISSASKYDYFANSTLKMYVDSSGIAKVYKGSELVLTSASAIGSSLNGKDYVLGGSNSDNAAYMRVTAIQIYDGFVI